VIRSATWVEKLYPNRDLCAVIGQHARAHTETGRLIDVIA
ncbi:uncharacterized protein METZ01_LOCUS353523, partial [marine metagenome]